MRTKSIDETAILTDVESGMSRGDVAKKHKICTGTVGIVCRRNGKPSYRRMDEADFAKIKELRSQGMTVEAVAKALSRTPAGVCGALQRMGMVKSRASDSSDVVEKLKKGIADGKGLSTVARELGISPNRAVALMKPVQVNVE
jgi:hypothetical protein